MFRNTMRALVAVGLSMILVLLLTFALFATILAASDTITGTDLLATLAQSTRYGKYELQPVGSVAARYDELLDRARASGLDADLERTKGRAYLVIRGGTGGGTVHDVMSSNGYRSNQFVLGYSMLGMPAFLAESPKIFGLLLACQFASFAGVGWYGMRKMPRHGATATRWRTSQSVALGTVVGSGAILVGWLVERAQGALGIEVVEQSWVTGTFAAAPWTTATLIVILAPMSEEIFFRGYVFTYLSKSVNIKFGYISSAVVFTGIHFNPSATAVYFVYGLLLAFAMHQTGRIVAPIAGHVVINAVAILAMLAS